MTTQPNPVPTEGVFQLGLCMAGAVSAGAYTAGVLDFLIEALDGWEVERGRPGVPAHRVRLAALTGASAGGMCAGILLAALARRFPPARDEAGQRDNPLWQAWVEGPAIEALLDPSDLEEEAPLRSFLNVGVLQRIVDGVLDATPAAFVRPWVAERLPMALSVGNLRGVPYGMSLGGGHGTTLAHHMRMHGDSARFLLGERDPRRPDFWPLVNPPRSDDPGWRAMGLAALASGAFPFFLESRVLTRSGADYAARKILIPGDGHPCSEFRDPVPGTFAPEWPEHKPPEPYHSLNVDGGIFDNEPLDLCRGLLCDEPGQRLVRDGLLADRTVLMIDPFPDAVGDGPATQVGLLRTALAMTAAWKMQARFGSVDVALAAAPDVYSRMMIAPTGSGQPRPGGPLAAGGLGAFLGFLHREFRRYDFALGRRNCQRFLRLHLALPAQNPLFRGDANAFLPADARHEAELAASWESRRGTTPAHIPVIPLLGRCGDAEPMPEWPAGRLDPASLAGPIGRRLDAVARTLLREAPVNGVFRWLGRRVWAMQKGRAVEAAVAKIQAELERKALV